MLTRIISSRTILGLCSTPGLVQTIRRTANLSADKNILIYSNLGFNLTYARLLAVAAPFYVAALGSTIKYMNYHYSSQDEESLTKTGKQYKKYGNLAAFLMIAGSGVLAFTINAFISTYIREIFLSSSHRNITFSLYKTFGPPKEITVSVNNVKLQAHKIVVKGHIKPLLLSKEASYPNINLFNKAMGVYRH